MEISPFRSKLKQRKSLHLPSKIFHLNTFSNEYVDKVLTLKPHQLSLSQPLKDRKVKAITPKIEHNQNRITFDQFATMKTRNTRRLTQQSQRRPEQYVNRMGMRRVLLQKNKRSKTIQEQDRQEIFPSEMRKSLYLDNKKHEQFKSKLQQRFLKTRMLLKQEAKAKIYEKLTKFWFKKPLLSKRSQHSQQKKQYEERQHQNYSPWRRRVKKHQIYQIMEHGESQQQF